MEAMLPGMVLKILVEVGSRVEVGDPLVIIEAMKAENEMTCEEGGVVKEILVKEGDSVQTGQQLMVIE